MNPNSSGHYRGLHIVVINPLTGHIITKQVFDTHISSEELN